MATIHIVGSAVVLKSALSLKDVQKLSKYDPDSMILRDDSDKLIFKAAVAAAGTGDWTEKAVYFAPVSHDPDGLATVTVGIPEAILDAKEWAVDQLLHISAKLERLEEKMSAAVTRVDDAKTAMMEQITVL